MSTLATFAKTLFDTAYEYGVLSQLVMEEHLKDTEPDYDLEAVKHKFIEADCPNAVFVLDWAQRHFEIEHFGFGTIYESDISNAPKSPEEPELGQLYFGNLDMGISPTTWLVYLSARIHEVPLWDRLRFDTVCGEIMLLYEDRPCITN